MNKECIVVIPVYKPLDIDEIMSVNQLQKETSDFKKVFVIPESFELDDTYESFKSFEVVRFADYFFNSIQGYNRLMLCEEFYERFLAYKYILIHQTDAYLFNDELAHWCSQGYDYLGAPWYMPKRLGRYNWFKFAFKYLGWLSSKEKLVRRRSYNCVGNGGLSLRKTASFLKVLSLVSDDLLNLYLDEENRFFNEDVFWSIEAPEINKEYNVPNFKIGAQFALESEAEKLYKLMGNKLPFGCHGFKKAEATFWKKHIPYQMDI